MLPVTSAIQKVMLPILNRPVIDYVVADVLAAGVEHIIFVINPGSTQLQDYFLGNKLVDELLRHHGKTAELEQLEKLHSRAKFTFVEQNFDAAGYGTNVPLLLAENHLPSDEAFIYCYGDAWLKRADGKSEFAELVQTFQESEADAAITGLELPPAELARYGALGIREAEGREYLDDFVEKPAPGEAPSNLSNLGFYVLTSKIFPYAKAVKANDRGEYYVTDALKSAAADLKIAIHRTTGQFLDAGNLESWLEANLAMASANPALAKKLGDYSPTP